MGINQPWVKVGWKLEEGVQTMDRVRFWKSPLLRVVGGAPLQGLVVAFQEEQHHIVASDTRGLDLTAEKIISIPESLQSYLAQGLSCTDRYAGRAPLLLFRLRGVDTRLWLALLSEHPAAEIRIKT